MKSYALLLALFAVSPCTAETLHFDVEGAKNRPISKVITLLKDMQAQLQTEATEDEEIYDKVACWCETNDKDKSQAIMDAEARITDLTSRIEELTAQSSRLNTEIKNLDGEIAKNQESLDKATALREKQLAEFNGEEKEMLQCVSALKSAIIVLAKHHSGSFVDEGSMLEIGEMVRDQMHKHRALLVEVITPHQRKVMSQFIQTPEDAFLQAAPYNPQSGEVFGILKQMKETFESDLSQSQKEEINNAKAFEELKSAKEDEIAAGQAAVESKTQELASTDEKNAQSKEDIEDTRNSLSADEKFLMDLKLKCQMTDSEWEERQKTRQEEISAVSEAISILSNDDAHDLFTKTFNPAFLQVARRTVRSERRDRAAQMLVAAGRKFSNPALVQMATRVHLDAFTRVKKAIDDMVVQLLKEKEDEIKHKDFCVGGLNENEKTTETTDRDKSDVTMKIEDLEMSIKGLEDEINTLKAEIVEMQTQLKRAGEDRELENKEFQTTVADQRATQKLLNQALAVLKGVYAKKAAASALAQVSKQGPPPPPGFQDYKKSGAAGGVMGMISQIINDAKAMEAEAIHAEESAQKAYEGFVQESNRSVDEKSTGIVNKQEDKAKDEADKTASEEKKAQIALELEQLANENADLHKACDFVVKNFDVRQEARDQEVEALRQAKAILSGAKFEASLLQDNHEADLLAVRVQATCKEAIQAVISKAQSANPYFSEDNCAKMYDTKARLGGSVPPAEFVTGCDDVCNFVKDMKDYWKSGEAAEFACGHVHGFACVYDGTPPVLASDVCGAAPAPEKA